MVFLIFSCLIGISAYASERNTAVISTFESYVELTQARMDDEIRHNQFLVIDHLADPSRREAYDQLQHGQIHIEELHTLQGGGPISIPNALIHHWAGVIFIPDVRLSKVIDVIEDYDNQSATYKPEIRRSKLIEHSGNESKIYIQFVNKSIVTVVLNVYFDVADTQFSDTRHQAVSRSTQIAEVANPGSPNEHDRHDDDGYVLRLNNYWRMEEKDGGVYAQNESITLSRNLPTLIAWFVNPLINNVPRNLLLSLLTDTRAAVIRDRAATVHWKHVSYTADGTSPLYLGRWCRLPAGCPS